MVDMSDIGIVGYGIVGEAVEYGFNVKGNNILYYDKYKPCSSLEDVVKSSEFIFVCVPTPYKIGGIDLSIMDENIEGISELSKNTDKIIIIKSTIIPGTTRNYAKKYKENNFCFSPEFLREAHYKEDFVNADRIVIGADDEDINQRVTKLHKKRFPNINIFITNPTTAEISKYASNFFLAMKIIYANEIYDLCEEFKTDYNEVKEIVAADNRINKAHLDVTPERGFGGKCFYKDMEALIGVYNDHEVDSSLLKVVQAKNLKIRKVRDWEEIPFVKSDEI